VSRLAEFLAPKAIAIVGCPGDLSRPGVRPLVHLPRHGFAGALYPVNPRHARIGGLPAFPSLRERPSPPDMVWIGSRPSGSSSPRARRRARRDGSAFP